MGNDAEKLKDSPLLDEHERLGARFMEFGEHRVVADYGIDYAIDVPLENPLLMDLSFQSLIRVSGKDSGYFLHTVLTADINSLSQGNNCHSLMLDGEGNVIDQVLVVCSGDDEYMLLVDEPVASEVLSWLQDIASAVSAKNGLFAAVKIEDAGDELAAISIIGPDRFEMLNELRTQENAPDMRIQLGSGTCFTTAIGNIAMLMVSDEAASAIDIFTSPVGANALWQALLSFPDLQAIGFNAYKQVMGDFGLWLDGIEDGRYLSVSESGLAHMVRQQRDFVGANAIK